MRRVIRSAIKRTVNLIGVDIVRTKNLPEYTLAGLRGRSIHTVIDCGANEGQFARYVSQFFPSSLIFCFEPLPEPFTKLRKWAETQGGRVACFNVALGESEEVVQMHFHSEHSASSSLLSTTDHEEQLFPQTRTQRDVSVSVTTLDKVLADHVRGFTPEVLLKLDVQGFEDRVLRGARNLLRSVDACIAELSLDPLYEGQATFKDVVSLLDDHEFRYSGNFSQSYGDDGRIMWLDALFLKRS